MDVAGRRKTYARGELDEQAAGDDPLALFGRWYAEAVDAGLTEPNAMTLATVGPQGRPSTRIVLVKGFGPEGLDWFTNYASRKGRELADNPNAALQFHWVELERVVRIEGTVVRLPAAVSDAYFASRPLGSRLGAWASPQSQVIADRDGLREGFEAASRRFGDNPPRPDFWGGYRLTPSEWQFWQGRPDRLHDRLRFRTGPTGWLRERLAP